MLYSLDWSTTMNSDCAIDLDKQGNRVVGVGVDQGGVRIIILDWRPVGWFSCQAAKFFFEPQDIWLKNSIDGFHEAL